MMSINAMHAKPDLRVFKMDDHPFRLGDRGRYPSRNKLTIRFLLFLTGWFALLAAGFAIAFNSSGEMLVLSSLVGWSYSSFFVLMD